MSVYDMLSLVYVFNVKNILYIYTYIYIYMCVFYVLLISYARTLVLFRNGACPKIATFC